jgi:hypothetical protein
MATTTYGTPYVAGTDLVANWPAASLTVANSIDAAGYYVGRGTNTQTGSYTLVLTDAGKNITQAVNTANTITIPTNSSVAFPIGTRVNIINLGSGACTPTAAGGVTIAGTITALAINEYASLVKTGTNTWSYLAAPTPAAPGLSLVTPTSVAGTGVTVSGGEISFSGSTSISANGVFTSDYTNYVIYYALTGVSAANPDLKARLRLAGTDSTTNYATVRVYSNGGTVSTQTTGSTGLFVGAADTGSPSLSGGDFTLLRPAVAVATIMNGEFNQVATLAEHYWNRVSGFHSTATAYDGVTIVVSSGNVTGSLRIYGLKAS